MAELTGTGLVEDTASASADYVVGSLSCLGQPGPVVPASRQGGGTPSGTQPVVVVTPAIGLPNTSAAAGGAGAVVAVASGVVLLLGLPLGRRLRARRSR